MFPAGVAGIRTRMVELHGGLRLRVSESGAAGAPPVLLLHGWGASIYMWRSWFAPLARMGYRVLAADLPGHGLSDKPEDAAVYRLAPLTQVVRELLDVERLERVDVVAQSMGGTIALELALAGESRIGRLALVNPAAFGVIPPLRLTPLVRFGFVGRLMPHLLTRGSVARAHRLVYGDPSRITSQNIDQYWAPSQFPAYSRALWRLALGFTWDRHPAASMAERLRASGRQVQVILGGRDRLVLDARGYVESLLARDAPLHVSVVEQGGHAVNEEYPADVMRLVTLGG
ncbi:MAG TPA: alpha/beta fold hydrolase [Gemmatimonadaceae bacterium]|nr:alpha/beta fold hydrolase [Gemmatimonadaceae bacterium]